MSSAGCKALYGGAHCEHPLSGPEIRRQCCNCGEIITYKMVLCTPQGHGSKIPEEYKVNTLQRVYDNG